MIERATFVAILSALLAVCDEALVREAKNLLYGRERELRAARVRKYSPGQFIVYLLKDGKTEQEGTIDHLNQFSVSVKRPHATQGYITEVVPIERILPRYYGSSHTPD